MKKLTSLSGNLATLITFTSHHPIPEDLEQHFILNVDGPYPSISIYSPDTPISDAHASFMSFLGDTFGRDGWSAKYDRYDNEYDWSKTLDGVLLTINGAAAADLPTAFPVPPHAFPIMLAEQGEARE